MAFFIAWNAVGIQVVSNDMICVAWRCLAEYFDELNNLLPPRETIALNTYIIIINSNSKVPGTSLRTVGVKKASETNSQGGKVDESQANVKFAT